MAPARKSPGACASWPEGIAASPLDHGIFQNGAAARGSSNPCSAGFGLSRWMAVACGRRSLILAALGGCHRGGLGGPGRIGPCVRSWTVADPDETRSTDEEHDPGSSQRHRPATGDLQLRRAGQKAVRAWRGRRRALVTALLDGRMDSGGAVDPITAPGLGAHPRGRIPRVSKSLQKPDSTGSACARSRRAERAVPAQAGSAIRPAAFNGAWRADSRVIFRKFPAIAIGPCAREAACTGQPRPLALAPLPTPRASRVTTGWGSVPPIVLDAALVPAWCARAAPRMVPSAGYLVSR